MDTWRFVRGAILLLVAAVSFVGPLGAMEKPPLGWSELLLIVLVTPVMLVLVIGVQAFNRWSATVWTRPSWSANPFNFAQPLQFFHLVAYAALVSGLVTLLRIALSSIPFYVEALAPMAMACGVLVGLQVVMLLFHSRLQRGT